MLIDLLAAAEPISTRGHLIGVIVVPVVIAVLWILKRWVYATPATAAACGATALLAHFGAKQGLADVHGKAALTRQTRVDGRPTYADRFAASVTRLDGDRVKPDATDDLPVAPWRAGRIPDSELLMHVMAHHWAIKHG